MANRTTIEADPKEKNQKPPYQEPPQEAPGSDEKMRNRADHGEESYRGSGRLTGKTALITGGDSGIGRAVAIAFAREGADVAISFLPEEQKDADETIRWVEQAGRKSSRYQETFSRYSIAAISSNRRSPGLATSTSWSTTPLSRRPTKRSTSSPRKSGIGHSAPTSTQCSTWPKRRCRA